MKILQHIKDQIKDLPTSAGVYYFLEKGTPIYIGKAINIRERVKNHFLQPTYKDDIFIEKIDQINFTQTNSEIEALLLEASLIKKHQPKFNQVWRDDKNYFYVAISKGQKPVIYITHQKNTPKTIYIGPFVEGTSLKKTLKFLRKVFPYYTSDKHPEKKCTWCHLGLCPGPKLFETPPSPEASEGLREYKKSIKKLQLVLEGKRKTALYSLKKEMEGFSKQKNFEKALEVRDKIYALENVMAHGNVISGETPATRTSSFNPWEKTEKIFRELLRSKEPISKIECYDISNIQGKQAVGSMVVFVNGKPDKSQYKKFRIKMENKPNDIAMLKEVLTRRLRHPEWGYPDAMLIDGGIAQLNVGINAKNADAKTQNIKIISIAKGKQELLIEGQKEHIPLKSLPQEIYNVIVHLDDEAHRFAISYHKNIRSREMLTE
ncbi:GIY-YIG nuclease family protein [Candidatus Parcubacteria bacterium]|nr:GIY-YIG nuclease family protein [Candidatus Parcubacteria bacterium]